MRPPDSVESINKGGWSSPARSTRVSRGWTCRCWGTGSSPSSARCSRNKRAPPLCPQAQPGGEQIPGLARVVRGNLQSALENIPVERMILPSSFILTDYILRRTTEIIDGLPLTAPAS